VRRASCRRCARSSGDLGRVLLRSDVSLLLVCGRAERFAAGGRGVATGVLWRRVQGMWAGFLVSIVTILVVLQRSGRVRFATLGVESGSWVGAALRSPRPCAPTRARRHSRRGLLPPAPIQECSPPRRDAGQRRQRRILPAACSFARRRRVHGRIGGKRPGTSSRTAPGRVVARGRRPGGASRGPTSAAGRVLHRPSAHPLIWPASLIGWIGERAHGQLLTRVRARTGWSMRCAPAKRWSRVRIVHRGGLRRTTTDDTPVFASLGRIPGNSGA
jgi:hypothetical protein